MAIIVTYACILTLHHLGEPPVISSLIETSSTVFTVIFAVELILKAMAYGFVKIIKRSPVDVYDWTVVCVALVAMFLDLLYGISFNALASTARVTRVLMVFKVMRGAHALQEVCYYLKIIGQGFVELLVGSERGGGEGIVPAPGCNACVSRTLCWNERCWCIARMTNCSLI